MPNCKTSPGQRKDIISVTQDNNLKLCIATFINRKNIFPSVSESTKTSANFMSFSRLLPSQRGPGGLGMKTKNKENTKGMISCYKKKYSLTRKQVKHQV